MCEQTKAFSVSRNTPQDFSGGPVVETSPSNAGGVGSILGQGAKIQHASGPKNHNIKTEAIL